MRQGCVYFVEDADGLVKIGFSTNLPLRLAALGRLSANNIRLIGAVPGSMSLERALHSEFSSDRIRGEWFSPSTLLASRIREMLDAGSVAHDFAVERQTDKFTKKAEKIVEELIEFTRLKHKCKIIDTWAILSDRFGFPKGLLEKLYKGTLQSISAERLDCLESARVELMRERLADLRIDLEIAKSGMLPLWSGAAERQLEIAGSLLEGGR